MQSPNENLTGGNIKAAMKEAGASSSDLWMVPIGDIRVLSGFNVRTRNDEYDAHIKEISESILANGFYKDKPLAGYVAREGLVNVIYLTDGHSRLEAAKIAIAGGAEISVLPVVTKPAGTSLEDLTVGLVTSNSGRPLTPIEKGAVCKRLLGFGWDVAMIAKRLGLTKSYVTDLINLTGAPIALRSMVESGEVSAANAVTAIRKHGDKAAEVVGEKLTSAKASGKKKVTKKSLAPKSDVLKTALEWANREPLMDRYHADTVSALLSHLTGVDDRAIFKQIRTA
jgi:ParB family chromosome partitioning protein